MKLKELLGQCSCQFAWPHNNDKWLGPVELGLIFFLAAASSTSAAKYLLSPPPTPPADQPCLTGTVVFSSGDGVGSAAAARSLRSSNPIQMSKSQMTDLRKQRLQRK